MNRATRIAAALFLIAVTIGAQQSVTVVDVIDGDTILADDGNTYDLAGLTAPVEGQPGYQEAVEYLSTFVDEEVTLLWVPPEPPDYTRPDDAPDLIEPADVLDGVRRGLYYIAPGDDPVFGSAPYAWSWRYLYDREVGTSFQSP